MLTHMKHESWNGLRDDRKWRVENPVFRDENRALFRGVLQ